MLRESTLRLVAALLVVVAVPPVANADAPVLSDVASLLLVSRM